MVEPVVDLRGALRDIPQRTQPGVQTVHPGVRPGGALGDRPSGPHPLNRRRADRDLPAVAGDGDDVVEGQIMSG